MSVTNAVRHILQVPLLSFLRKRFQLSGVIVIGSMLGKLLRFSAPFDAYRRFTQNMTDRLKTPTRFVLWLQPSWQRSMSQVRIGKFFYLARGSHTSFAGGFYVTRRMLSMMSH